MYSRPSNSHSSSGSNRRRHAESFTQSSSTSAASATTTSSSSNNYHAASSSSNQDKYDRFEQWLRDNGAQFEMLELCEYESMEGSSSNSARLDVHANNQHQHAFYHEEKKEATQSLMEQDGETSGNSELRGVYAKSYIPPNSICMSVPRKCLITVEMGQATPIGQLIIQSDLDLDAPKHIFLMVYLLWDRKVNGPKSFYWPYYEILPQTLRNMPIFWSQDELDELEGSHLLRQIHDRNQAIAEDYYSICQIAPQLAALCTLDEFKWARMCVCSRNFGLVVDGHRTSALVPHADMLNHYRPRQTKWTFDEDRQAFTITTLQPIMGGAQVYDSYGQKCNHRFLLNYGFAVEENRELDGFCPNEVPLELFVDPDDELFAEKLEFWKRGEIDGGSSAESYPATEAATCTSYQVLDASTGTNVMPVMKRVRVCVANNENTRILFSLLRSLACNRAELDSIMSPFRTTLSRQSNHHPFDAQCSEATNQTTTARSMFGLPETPNQLMQQYRSNGFHQTQSSSSNAFSASNAITPLSYNRSCRDIRHPISIENERAAMRLLLDVVHRHLSQYPTSLARDIQDLEEQDPCKIKYPPYSNKRHALIQVRGEKEVLHHYMQWASVALDVLDVLDEELKEERGSVEAQLLQHGQVRTEERPSFESVIRQMEEDVDLGSQHHTILRHCADVLGSLRREEFKSIRRARVQQFASASRSIVDGRSGRSGTTFG
ncbi:hypothetical protein MPSEU_000009700 [Mayamaea pseudoterrestris]|nr:hypothetical protein MPSEU_000009700 [Mayamaea pseudoterrestris]